MAINSIDTNSLSKQDCIMLFKDARDAVTLDLIDAPPLPNQFHSLSRSMVAALNGELGGGKGSPAAKTRYAQLRGQPALCCI